MSETASQIYDRRWLQGHAWTNAWSTRVFLFVLSQFWPIETYLDVGCGDGHLPELAARLGIRSVGLDVAPVGPSHVPGCVLASCDLSNPVGLDLRFDLVTSWEVAEHIPASKADIFVENIVGHAKRRILFTAAVPKQGGVGHVNEQPNGYWITKFKWYGFDVNYEQTDLFRSQLPGVAGKCRWYANNMLVFQK